MLSVSAYERIPFMSRVGQEHAEATRQATADLDEKEQRLNLLDAQIAVIQRNSRPAKGPR